jgi:hypothetical protein
MVFLAFDWWGNTLFCPQKKYYFWLLIDNVTPKGISMKFCCQVRFVSQSMTPCKDLHNRSHFFIHLWSLNWMKFELVEHAMTFVCNMCKEPDLCFR